MIIYCIFILIILFLIIKKYDIIKNKRRNIYVINLDRDIERYDKIKKQSKMFKLNRISAVDGKKINIDDLKKDGTIKMNNESFIFSKDGDRDVLNGSIGCSLSHINLWKKMKKSRDNEIIIFEDDSIITNNTHNEIDRCLENIKQIDKDWDIIFLGGSRIYGERMGNFIKAKYVGSWMNCGLFAYIINKKSIDKLLKTVLPINTYIDMQMNRYYGNGINAYYTNPSAVKHNYDFGSSRDVNLSKYDDKFIQDANTIFYSN